MSAQLDAMLADAANFRDNLEPDPQAVLDIPSYYGNAESEAVSQKAKDNIALQSWAAEALALAWRVTGDRRCAVKAAAILDAWATTLTNWGPGGDSALVLGYKGFAFISAAQILGAEYAGSADFRMWLYRVYEPCCETLANRWNNWGCVGLCGLAMSARYVPAPGAVISLRDRLQRKIKFGTMRIPFFARQGEVWTEQLRATGKAKYTYAWLAECLQAAMSLQDETALKMLFGPLEIYWTLVQSPGMWEPRTEPWYSRVGLLPCPREFEAPYPSQWPANLFAVAGHIYNQPHWSAYGADQRLSGVDIWRYPEVMIQAGVV